jgi:hypothetical protein
VNDITPLYNVTLIEKNNAHYYSVEGYADHQMMGGVTGYLESIGGQKTHALMGWAVKEALAIVEHSLLERLDGKPEKRVFLSERWVHDMVAAAKHRPHGIKTEAADIGTRVHAYLDAFVKGKQRPVESADMKPCLDAFFKWWRASDIEILLGDTKVASLQYHYGGSLDWLGRDRDGKIVLGDFKTAKGMRPAEFEFQLGGYNRALSETYNITSDRAVIVRLDKITGMPEIHEVPDLDDAFTGFLWARNLSISLSEVERRFKNASKSSVKAGGRKGSRDVQAADSVGRV